MNNCRCGKPAKPNRKLCDSCTKSNGESKKRQNEKLKESGLCITCRQHKESNDNLRCQKCTFENSLCKLFGSKEQYSNLIKLLDEQQNKCAYSGLLLVIGINASVDHRTPKSKGGSNELDNLQWVDIRINKMKGDMTHEKFVVFLQSFVESYCLSNFKSY
jgi:5-methylcytosine-specific restriction endonuclease McrA